MASSWKNVKNGKCNVVLGVKTTEEKRFSIPGIAFAPRDIVRLLDTFVPAKQGQGVRVKGSKASQGGSEDGVGANTYVNSGQQNPADLAVEVRMAFGLKAESKADSKAEKRAEGTLPAPSSNGHTVPVVV